MTTLTFQTTTLSAINQNNQIWLTASDIGKALGYSQGIVGVTKLYNAHADEFTPCMTALIDMQTAGGMQKVRIFSLRGCHLIGMLSHTKVAKDFRRWVLDILDREITETTPKTPPVAEPTYTRELTERQWLRFASLWFALHNNLELLGRMYKPLEALGSRYGVEAYTHWSEYQTTLGALQRLLVPMLAEFEADPMQDGHFHKALKTLREYKPHGLGAIVRI